MWVKRPSPRHCQLLGEAMARMHLAGADFTMVRPNNLSVAGWRPLYEACAGRADTVKPGLGQELARELAVLEQAWPTDLPGGVVHAEPFPDNLFSIGRAAGRERGGALV